MNDQGLYKCFTSRDTGLPPSPKIGQRSPARTKTVLDQPNSHSDQIPYRKGHQLHGNSQPSTSSAYILKQSYHNILFTGHTQNSERKLNANVDKSDSRNIMFICSNLPIS